MKKITFKQYLEKAGQLLEKYRNNFENLRKLRVEIEKQFFMPNEMVEYFYGNKSEYNAWKKLQENILTLEDAYTELVAAMMSAMANEEVYEYYLKDGRLPVMIEKPEEEGEEKEKQDKEDKEDKEEE